MIPPYPHRPQYFACQYARLLTKRTVANEIGAPACWLLTVIAMTEDARGYTDPVTYYNEQLAPLVGVGSVDALDRVRKKCIEAGWLVYIPGGRRTGAGRYWVTIPERYLGTDDAPTDEGKGRAPGVLLRENAEQTAEQTASKPRNLLPVPVPVPFAAPAAPAPEREPKKPAKEKKPRPRNPLFDALVEVTGSDPVVNGKYVGRVAALFASANPPYTPDEVHDFARDWRLLLPWAKPSEHPRLTLGIVEKYLPQLRAAKLLSRPSQEFRPPPDFDTQPLELTP